MLRHGLDSLLAAVPLLSRLSPNLPEQDLAPPQQALQATATDSMRSLASSDRGGVCRTDTGRLPDTNLGSASGLAIMRIEASLDIVGPKLAFSLVIRIGKMLRVSY